MKKYSWMPLCKESRCCRHILGNTSFITLPIYIFVKKCGLLFLYCFWSLTSLFSILSSLFSPPASSFSPTKGQDFFQGQIFSSFLHLIHLSFPFLLYANPYPCEKEAWKLYYTSHSHKLNLADKRKTSKSLRHGETTLRCPYLQQLNEDVKNLFKDTTPTIFSGFPLLWKENVLTSKFFQC